MRLAVLIYICQQASELRMMKLRDVPLGWKIYGDVSFYGIQDSSVVKQIYMICGGFFGAKRI